MHRPAALLAVLIAALLLALPVLAGSALAARHALVIGNQNYANLDPLQKALGDATAYGKLFTDKQFDSVTVLDDLTRQDMDIAIAEFVERIAPGDTAVFVYSGHGWSDGSQNYLIGVDAPRRSSEELLARISIPIRNGVNGVMDEIEARGASLKVAIIDACRDNPFEASNPTRSIGMTRGLNRFSEPPPEGTFMVFSAGAGQVALDRLSDSDPHPNALFTRTIIPLLAQDLTLLDAIKSTQETVFEQASLAGFEQQPSYYDETRGNKACLSPACTSASFATRPVDPADSAAWATANSLNTADAFADYKDAFPDGAYGNDAVIRLADIAQASPSDVRILSLLGDIYRVDHRYDEAIGAYSRAIAFSPGNWALYYVRGISFERAQNWASAENDFRRALELSPNQAQVLNYLGYSLVDRDLKVDEGLSLIERAIAAAPGDGYIIDSLGWAHFKLGRFDKALGQLEKAVRMQPTDPEINEHVGDAYWRLDRVEEARFHWQIAKVLNKDSDMAARLDDRIANGLPPLQGTTN